MALTKTGASFLTKEAADTRLPEYLKNLFSRSYRSVERPSRRIAASRIARGLGRGAAGLSKGMYTGITRGVRAYGDALYHHPKMVVPATAALGYAAMNAPYMLSNNLHYANPNDNSVYMTSPALFRGTPYQINSPIPLKSIQGYPYRKGN